MRVIRNHSLEKMYRAWVSIFINQLHLKAKDMLGMSMFDDQSIFCVEKVNCKKLLLSIGRIYDVQRPTLMSERGQKK